MPDPARFTDKQKVEALHGQARLIELEARLAAAENVVEAERQRLEETAEQALTERNLLYEAFVATLEGILAVYEDNSIDNATAQDVTASIARDALDRLDQEGKP